MKHQEYTHQSDLAHLSKDSNLIERKIFKQTITRLWDTEQELMEKDEKASHMTLDYT